MAAILKRLILLISNSYSLIIAYVQTYAQIFSLVHKITIPLSCEMRNIDCPKIGSTTILEGFSKASTSTNLISIFAIHISLPYNVSVYFKNYSAIIVQKQNNLLKTAEIKKCLSFRLFSKLNFIFNFIYKTRIKSFNS